MTWRLEVPGRPPSTNDWYSSNHWGYRVQQKKEWGPVFLYGIRQAKLPKFTNPIHVSLTQFMKGVLRDADGQIGAIKLFLDSLKTAGNIPDDSPQYVRSVTLASRKGKGDKVVVVISEAGFDPEQDGTEGKGKPLLPSPIPPVVPFI